MEKRKDSRTGKDKTPAISVIKNLLLVYAATAVMLLGLSFFVYKFRVPEKTVTIVIIVLYVAACFLGGYLSGKSIKNKRFLWGFAVGSAYFVVLLLLSLIFHAEGVSFGSSFFTTYILCAGGGTLGGMLSS